MPVANFLSGVWSLGVDYGLNNYPVILESFDRSYPLSVNSENLIAANGNPNTMIRTVDTLESSLSVNGPVLFGPVADDGIAPGYNLEMIYPADSRFYGSMLTWNFWSQVYNQTSYISGGMMDNISLSIGDRANCTIKWFQDPPIQNILPPGHLALVNEGFGTSPLPGLSIPPMRVGSWYDFVVLIDGLGMTAKSMDFNFTWQYSLHKPIGGSDLFIGAFDNTLNPFMRDAMMHTPVRIFEGYSMTCNMTLVAMLNVVSPWGVVVPWEAPTFGPSTQIHDVALHESPNIDVVFLVDGVSVIYDFLPNAPIGAHVKGVDTNYKPGISEANVEIDFMIPL